MTVPTPRGWTGKRNVNCFSPSYPLIVKATFCPRMQPPPPLPPQFTTPDTHTSSNKLLSAQGVLRVCLFLETHSFPKVNLKGRSQQPISPYWSKDALNTLEHYYKKQGGSSPHGSVEMNQTRNHEVSGSIPGLAQWVKDPALP